MKTYKAVVEKPLLEIFYDQDAESPRKSNTNLGYFFTKESKYKSPDGNVGEIYNAMIEAESHIKAITRIIEENTLEKVKAIYPIYRYKHSGLAYHRGSAKGFDISNCGFYIITDKSLAEYGEHGKPIEALIDGELEEYTQWCNGEVYGFKFYDKDGNLIETMGNFYGLDDIKGYLGETWAKEDMSKYLK